MVEQEMAIMRNQTLSQKIFKRYFQDIGGLQVGIFKTLSGKDLDQEVGRFINGR